MATKDYSQLTAASDVQDADLTATFRSSGPLKKLTMSLLRSAYLNTYYLAKSGGTLTGALALASGTEALPGLTFDGDLNSGLYRLAADQLAFSVGGARVLTIDSAGVTPAAGKAWVGPVTGNADTATTAAALTTSRSITATGDATWTVSFNGSANVSAALTVVAADLTTAGKIEVATVAETSTGTDATRAVSPDGLAGSIFGTKNIQIAVTGPADAAITTGDGKAYVSIPVELNGMDLVSVGASVSTVSSSGAPTIQVRRKRAGADVDMLSTRITIDANEVDSATAATPPVINGSNDDVATGDQLYVDIDVAGTGAKGLNVRLGFRIP